MKYRSGFVSNSSSTSFVCEICGEIHEEEHNFIDNIGVVRCKNGHDFCIDHLTKEEREYVWEIHRSGYRNDDFSRFEIYSTFFFNIPTDMCPKCHSLVKYK